MQNPFLQNIGDIFSRLKGSSLFIAAGAWILIAAVALSCALGLIKLPGATSTPATPPTATPGIPTLAPTATTAGGFITLPTPTAPPAATPVPSLEPLPWGEFGYGIAAHIYEPYTTMDAVKNKLHLTWIKQQIRWDIFSTEPGKMDWSGYDPVVDAAEEKGLKLMFSIVGAPAWSRTYVDANPQAAPPDDFSLYGQFLGELVDRYKGRIHAIEVWNEQNLDREWDTAEGVNAARYVELLRIAYQVIKSRDPNIIVISGALSPVGASATDPANTNRVIYMDDFQYFQQMVDAGLLNYVDCVGAHHNGINMPPDVTWNEGFNDAAAQFRGPFDNPDHSWSFKSTLWGYHDMIVKSGQNKPLCLTEFGWATAEGLGGYPPGFEFALDNTLEEQALWDVQAFQLMRQWGFVRLAFLWNYDYSVRGGNPADPNAPYSLVDMDGAPRPSFGAVAEMPKVP